MPITDYLHLITVYIVWGSTFVAMRAAVMGNSGFQPFAVGASRLALASVVLFAWARFRKMKLRLKKRDLWVCFASGNLIWLGGNGLVMWAEQYVDAGYATLIFSTLPTWTILMGCILDRKAPSPSLLAAAFAAVSGMAILGGRDLLSNAHGILLPSMVILFSTILWAGSTHLQKRLPVSCSPFVGSAYQQLFGSMGVFVMALIMGESWPHPTAQAWTAWAYLVVFGSIIAYNSYLVVIKNFPPSVSMTFAYVCPVITVFLGFVILGEPLTTQKLGGMTIILSSVAWIFYDQRRLLRKPLPISP